jgi:hypothetical protein
LHFCYFLKNRFEYNFVILYHYIRKKNWTS